jgi:hypothetical protein
MGAAPAIPMVVPCNQPEVREVQARGALPAARPAPPPPNIHVDYEIIVVSSLSEGTGEVTAVLNVLPHLPANTYFMYGADAGADEATILSGQLQIRGLLGIVEAGGGAAVPLQWDHNNVRYRPRSWNITPGNRPILVLAPHGYTLREITFTAALPAHSVLVCWSPFAYSCPDLNRHGVRLGTPDGDRLLGFGASAALGGVQDHTNTLYSVVPPPPAFDPNNPATAAERFAVAAYTESHPDNNGPPNNNRLACVYGHGTQEPKGARVLDKLLRAAAAGTAADRWAIIFVIHHVATGDPNGRDLSTPANIPAAHILAHQDGWVEVVGFEGANPGFGVWTNLQRHIKIYHLSRLDKRCMDWMFNICDLPIVEGANSVEQLLAAGRPFLRAARGGNYLGAGTATIDAAHRAAHGPALDALRDASAYLSAENDDAAAAMALRSLLFTFPERAPLDALAVQMATTYFTAANSPLSFVGPYIDAMNRAPLNGALVHTLFAP